MAKRELSGPEMVAVMVETVGHRRAMTMLGASLVCGILGSDQWPEMGETLKRMGYSTAAVYKLRADFRLVGDRVEELEGEGVGLMDLVARLRLLPELTTGVLS